MNRRRISVQQQVSSNAFAYEPSSGRFSS